MTIITSPFITPLPVLEEVKMYRIESGSLVWPIIEWNQKIPTISHDTIISWTLDMIVGTKIDWYVYITNIYEVEINLILNTTKTRSDLLAAVQFPSPVYGPKDIVYIGFVVSRSKLYSCFNVFK